MIIFRLAPVEDQNKPLDDMEIILYRVRSQVVLVIEGLFLIACLTLKWKTGVVCITLAFLTLCLMLVFGTIKNLKLKVKS